MSERLTPVRLERVHHVAIICSDYPRSKGFYVDKLGGIIIKETFREQRQSYKLDISFGDSQIELFSFPDPPARPTQPEAAGLRHIAFEVENIDETVGALTGRGVVVESIRVDEITGKRFTFFPDPDDLPIELYER